MRRRASPDGVADSLIEAHMGVENIHGALNENTGFETVRALCPMHRSICLRLVYVFLSKNNSDY